MAPATSTVLIGGNSVGVVAMQGKKVVAPSSFFTVLGHVQWQHLVAGVSGGVISTVIIHPLDLIKIRFQGQCLLSLFQLSQNF